MSGSLNIFSLVNVSVINVLGRLFLDKLLANYFWINFHVDHTCSVRSGC